MSVFKDFILEEKVEFETIEKYRNELPQELISVWEEYGFGSFMNGYLRIINPNEYLDIVQEGYICSGVESAIPVLLTSFGDIFIWENNKYLNRLNFKRGRLDVVLRGMRHFFSLLEDKEFVKDELDMSVYYKAIEKLGIPRYNDCFGFVPLLALGGKETVDSLDIVKIKEHILIILALVGPIVID